VQALVVEKPGDPFEYQDVQLEDTIRDDEVLVEMKATGVCHTDPACLGAPKPTPYRSSRPKPAVAP